MKHTVHAKYLLLTLFFGVFAVIQVSAQMKIGNHPTQIQPASILELESNNQALRLTQGDTAEVNNIIASESAQNGVSPDSAAEGMIMYQKSDNSLYMRVGGYWRRVVSSANVDSTFWKLKGNTGTDSASSFLGTLDNQPLNMGANGNKYIIIHSNGVLDVLADSSYFSNKAVFGKSVTIADSLNVNNGALKVSDSVYIGKPMAIHDSIVIKGLGNALSSDSSVLVIGSGGVVRKLDMDSIGIRQINGVGGTYFHLKFDTVSAGHTGPWIDSTSLSEFSTLVLNIPDASPTVRGLVNTTTQAFGGVKSFVDSVAVGQQGAANSTFQVTGNVSVAQNIVTSATYDMTTGTNANYRTIVFDVTSNLGGVDVTLPNASNIDGRIYTFKKIGKTDDGQLMSPVKISTSNGETIDNDGATFNLYNNFTSVSLQAQNGNWTIVGH